MMLVGSAAVLCLPFLFQPAAAQSEDGGLHLVTSPIPINLVTEPGQTVTADLKVKNGGTQNETLKISLMKFKAYETTGLPQLMDPEPGDDFLNWVSLSEPTFTLAPEEWKTVTATFTVPKTAAFGYYYAFMFSRAGNPDNSVAAANGQTTLVGGTAVLVLLEARVPDAKRSLDVTEFSVDKQIYEFLPAEFTIKLKNNGNVHVAPRGNIFIEQGDTHNIAVLDVNAPKGNILPGSSRDFTAEWTDGFPVYAPKVEGNTIVHDEKGAIVTTLNWNWGDASKFRFGKYTAKMTLIYDDGVRDVPVEGEVSFWVIPWRMILGALVVALFILAGLRSFFIHLWRKVVPVKSKR